MFCSLDSNVVSEVNFQQYLLKPTNCTYLSNHLKPHNWIKMDLKYLLHVSIPLWDHPQGA